MCIRESSSAATAIDSFVAATYRGAKYVVSVTDTTNSRYETVEIIVTHNGSTPYISVYGRAGSTTTDLATFTADINSGSVRILVMNAAGSSTTYKFFKTLIPV